MTSRAVAKRLALREYAPFAAVVLAWLLVAAVAGHADAVRLLAAVTFVRAARALTAPAALVPLRKRLGIGADRRQATRAALAVEAAAVAGALLAFAALLTLLWWAGEGTMLLLCLLFGIALPARSLLPLAAGRALADVYRLTLGTLGLALVAIGWIAGADIYGFAALFAAREWLALPIAYLVARPIEPGEDAASELEWREIATHSYALGRKRAAYRFSKSFLQGLLGPIGGIAARTGRGIQLDRKLERFVPQHPASLGVVAIVATAVAVALIVYAPEPLLLALAASLVRLAAAAANVLLWGRLARGERLEISPTEDEDD